MPTAKPSTQHAPRAERPFVFGGPGEPLVPPPAVLVVEDEAMVAQDIARHLNSLGCVIIGNVSTGEDALEVTRAIRPELVVMDIQLRGKLDGVATAARLREQHNCALLFLTGRDDADTFARAEVLEPSAYVLKPYNGSSLRAAVHLALFKHRAHQERETIRRAQLKTEARLHAILDNTHDGVVCVDADAKIATFNKGAERQFGYEAAEVVGQCLSMLLSRSERPPEQRARDLVALSDGRETPLLRREIGRKKSGETFIMEVSLSHLGSGLGDTVVTCIRDVTQREMLERELRLADRLQAVGRVAASVTHDFNNLLTALESCSYLLGKHTDDAGTAHLNNLIGTIDRGRALTRQLLRFSRAESDLGNPVVVCLDDAVHGAESLLKRLLRKNISFAVDLGAPGAHVNVDAHLVEHVIMNLVINARDAMPGGGSVMVETSVVALEKPLPANDGCPLAPGDYAVIAVADTGSGIEEEHETTIFDPFFTTKSPGLGTGLGLWSARGMVRRCGGDIHFETSPGRGSVFSVLIPLHGSEVGGTDES